jgi:SAM-dependent methyltransferase
LSSKRDSSAAIDVSSEGFSQSGSSTLPNPSEAEFDRYAAEYAQLLKDPVRDLFSGDGMFFHRRKWELLRRALQGQGVNPASAEWLDVGCGKGELLSLGKSSFKRAAGCDPSAGMIRDGGDVILQTDPSKLPFGDASFDLVTAVCVYHHVPRHARPVLTAEMLRVLRPGGLACFIEHNPLNPVTQLIVSRTPVDADADLASHWRMKALVRSVGFRKPKCEFFLYFPENIYSKLAGVESLLRDLPLGGQYALFCHKPPIRQTRSTKFSVRSFAIV